MEDVFPKQQWMLSQPTKVSHASERLAAKAMRFYDHLHSQLDDAIADALRYGYSPLHLSLMRGDFNTPLDQRGAALHARLCHRDLRDGLETELASILVSREGAEGYVMRGYVHSVFDV